MKMIVKRPGECGGRQGIRGPQPGGWARRSRLRHARTDGGKRSPLSSRAPSACHPSTHPHTPPCRPGDGQRRHQRARPGLWQAVRAAGVLRWPQWGGRQTVRCRGRAAATPCVLRLPPAPAPSAAHHPAAHTRPRARSYPGVVIPDAYPRLILDAIRGDQQHFVRRCDGEPAGASTRRQWWAQGAPGCRQGAARLQGGGGAAVAAGSPPGARPSPSCRLPQGRAARGLGHLHAAAACRGRGQAAGAPVCLRQQVGRDDVCSGAAARACCSLIVRASPPPPPTPLRLQGPRRGRRAAGAGRLCEECRVPVAARRRRRQRGAGQPGLGGRPPAPVIDPLSCYLLVGSLWSLRRTGLPDGASGWRHAGRWPRAQPVR